MGTPQATNGQRLTRDELAAERERAARHIAGLENARPRSDGGLIDGLTRRLQDGFVLLNGSGVHLDVNPAFCEMVGYSRDELIGGGLPHPYWPPERRDRIERVLQANILAPSGVSEVEFMRRSGERFPAQIAPTVLRDETDATVCIFATVKDISARREAEAALHGSNRRLQALSSCNQALLRASDEETLLGEVCRIICDKAGYPLAWVGYADSEANGQVRLVASAADPDGGVATAPCLTDEVRLGRAPAAVALRSADTVMVADLSREHARDSLGEKTCAPGLRSLVVLPLAGEEGVPLGALLVYATEPTAFVPEEVELLEELAADLAFGIGVLRARAAHERTLADLRESEARYRTVVENAPVGVFQTTLRGQFLYVNPACAKTFGCDTAEQMMEFVNRVGIAKGIYEDPDDRRRVLADAHAAGGAWIAFKRPLHHRDGATHMGLVYLCERRDPANGEPGLLGFVQDVTIAEQATRALARASRLLGHGERLAHLGSWEWDVASGAHSVSKEWQRLHGLEGDSLPGDVVMATCHPEDRPLVEAGLRRAAAGGSYRVAHRIVRADDGEVRHLMTYGEPLFDERKRVQTLIGASLDVTERVRADAELREREDQLRRALGETVAALGATVAMRDPYTATHERRVAELACRIAARLGWSKEAIERLHTAALVHDIGKIAVPAEILVKPGRLTDTEFALITSHPAAAHAVLAPIGFAGDVAEIILQHHERLDGTGYPRGLRDGDILPPARVLAVADVVEAMVSHRPYRPALPLSEAVTELSQGSGSRYDAAVTEACLQIIQDDEFAFSEPT